MPTFAEFSMQPSLARSLAEQGITEPTEIQRRTLPESLAGGSVFGVAATGTGKTLSYALPMLHLLKEEEIGTHVVDEAGRPRGLVLVPGRELGEQVGKEFKKLTHRTRLRVRLALGGSPKRVSRKAVAYPFEILVATPGRLRTLQDSGDLSIDDVAIVAFDEADQILDPGFLPAARRLLRGCRPGAQVLLFSATLPDRLHAVVEELLPEAPLLVRTEGAGKLVPTVRVDNRAIEAGDRPALLARVLAEAPTTGTLLFANTREQCDHIGTWLDTHGVAWVPYRGEMDRLERRRNLAAFREGAVHVLVTTDLGGRGLDIDRVERVINVFLPREPRNYLHRAGRTARAGRSGTVVNLVDRRDAALMETLSALEG